MLRVHDIERAEPRWPAIVAIFAAAGLHLVLPPSMRVGPPWLLAGMVATLVAVAWIGRHAGLYRVNARAGLVIVAVLTAGLLYSMYQLVVGLLAHTEGAPALLRSAAIIWASNVLVFAVGYWRLDAGGPNERERRDVHRNGAFLFPQMAFGAGGTAVTIAEHQHWRPGFVDYLFLAFNTSTAFSPTDVPPLSRWAKLAMMVQATISFTTILLLVGRVVNIL